MSFHKPKPEIAFVDDTGSWAEIKQAGSATLLIDTARVGQMHVYNQYGTTCVVLRGDNHVLSSLICGWQSEKQAIVELTPIFTRGRQPNNNTKK